MTPTDRILPLEGVDNFRDFGGYAAADGRYMRSGRFWRSAHHGRATEADLVTIRDLGLTAVVDLRRPRERESEPSRRPTGFAGEIIECDLGDRAEAPHVAFLRDTDLTPASVDAFFLDYYTQAPFEPRHPILFRRYFQALLGTDASVLIHCTAGKDRTGLLAALTHHVLGVHQDDVLADFMLTNTAARVEARAPLVAEALARSLGKIPSDTAVRLFLGVDGKYLDAALKAITQQSGSLETYLADLGVDRAAIIKLRDRYLT
ncbi:MAG: protein tyrosine phosphatase [Phenylobacterium zucineum]|nr:MAG: protein tyrosine phosphatase [Phenylobacterium zucineum]